MVRRWDRHDNACMVVNALVQSVCWAASRMLAIRTSARSLVCALERQQAVSIIMPGMQFGIRRRAREVCASFSA